MCETINQIYLEELILDLRHESQFRATCDIVGLFSHKNLEMQVDKKIKLLRRDVKPHS